MRPSCCRRRSPKPSLLVVLSLAIAGCVTPTVDQERQLGNQMAWEARTQHRFLADPVVVGYVTDIGEGILRAAGPQPFEYHFQIVDDPEINAFAGPAGFIYIQTGTILAARDVDELAGVIAHEIGHVVERHVAENYARVRGASLAHTAGVAAASLFGFGGLANVVGGWGLLMTINSFGRSAEMEADAFAVQVMPLAGYDPRGLVTFFQTMLGVGGPDGGFLSNHPATEDRIETTTSLIAREPPVQGALRVHDRGRLQIIQRRIELLTGAVQPGGSARGGSTRR